MAILAGLYLLTNLLAAYMTNIAAISIVLPIALSYASSVGLQHLPFTLCVAFAGSKNFITPIGYQTNLMVYGPGGYKFNDFMRVGLPLTIIFMIVTLATIKLFYL
jgi:di/tricarboxylate transporter